MARFEISRKVCNERIYNVQLEGQAEIGMVVNLGDRIEDDVYEVVAPQANGKVLFIWKPEVDADERLAKNSLALYQPAEGEILNAEAVPVEGEITIGAEGVEGASDPKVLSVVGGKLKLQGKASAGDTDIAVFEVLDTVQTLAMIAGSIQTRVIYKARRIK